MAVQGNPETTPHKNKFTRHTLIHKVLPASLGAVVFPGLRKAEGSFETDLEETLRQQDCCLDAVEIINPKPNGDFYLWNDIYEWGDYATAIHTGRTTTNLLASGDGFNLQKNEKAQEIEGLIADGTLEFSTIVVPSNKVYGLFREGTYQSLSGGDFGNVFHIPKLTIDQYSLIDVEAAVAGVLDDTQKFDPDMLEAFVLDYQQGLNPEFAKAPAVAITREQFGIFEEGKPFQLIFIDGTPRELNMFMEINPAFRYEVQAGVFKTAAELIQEGRMQVAQFSKEPMLIIDAGRLWVSTKTIADQEQGGGVIAFTPEPGKEIAGVQSFTQSQLNEFIDHDWDDPALFWLRDFLQDKLAEMKRTNFGIDYDLNNRDHAKLLLDIVLYRN